ncbi:MAG TPA: hypothetical protein PKC19_09395, partial [Roseiflexaceae bacterium]|nr:hypothetical protein [Roseiflexaceae bacterium]
FLLLGILAWAAALRTDRGRSWPSALLAGLGFGMALITKNQFVLIVPAALFAAALLDWRYYRVGNWVVRIVPLVVASGRAPSARTSPRHARQPAARSSSSIHAQPCVPAITSCAPTCWAV